MHAIESFLQFNHSIFSSIKLLAVASKCANNVCYV